MKLHQKGFLLRELARLGKAWDDELLRNACDEYGRTSRMHAASVRIALDELAAGGLICAVDEVLDDAPGRTGRLRFNYRLTDFGRQRTLDTGL